MAVAERPIDRGLPLSDQLAPILARPLFGVLPLDLEKALYAVFVMVGAALRFWDLGPRMLHHDESLHALYSWYLYTGRGYVHDPMMHGPFLFEWGALWYFLLGATDSVARFAPALFGVALIGLCYYLREFIGRTAALVAAALMTVAPTILYYSRFDRHDIYLAGFQFVFFLSVFRYLRRARTADLLIGTAALSLCFSTKEDTYLVIGYLGAFLVFLLRRELGDIARLVLSAFGIGKGPTRQLSAAADVAILIGTLTLPLVSGGLEYLMIKMDASADFGNTAMVACFAVLALIGALVGLKWNSRVWVTAAVIFWGIFVALYTTFFSNPGGLFSGSVGGLKYWIDQQGVARGNQPWFYYLLLLPLYEFVAVLFGTGGAIYLLRPRRQFGYFMAAWAVGALLLFGVKADQMPGAVAPLALYFALPLIVGVAGASYFFRPRTLFDAFLVWWAVGALVAYGWASEKMPWMVIHMAIPFVLMSGVAIARLLEQVELPRQPMRQVGLYVLTLFLAGAALISGVIRLGAAGGPQALLQTLGGTARNADVQSFFQALGLVVVAGVLLYFGLTIARRLGDRLALKLAALASLLILMPLSLRAAWQVSYYNGDVPVEMLIYTQTSPDVGMVMKEVDRIAFRTGVSTDKLKVVYDSGVSWPFEWYLRDYKSRVFIGGGNIPANGLDAPVVIIGTENNHDAQIKQQLGSKYVAQRFRLRWWFPEDYRSMTLESFRWFLFDPATRQRIWRYFMFRETLNPLGSTDFYFFVRRDLAAGPWAAPLAASQQADPEVYTKATKPLQAVQTIGGTRGSGQGEFVEPKNVAIAPDGSLFVADSGNHRIEKFDKDGKFVLAFGAEGTDDGQFKDGPGGGPWGIAVGQNGDVYVADTWNHRVQRFDANGKFKSKFGTQALVANATDAPGAFFGPRGIAVDPAGNLLVTDAGNHRVERFDQDGKFLTVFGGRGAGDGLFQEPVGIAVDKSGNIYVADTWNHRVQKLDPNGKYVAQWAIAGWDSESVVNKPYLAVDGEGSIYLTDPEGHRAVKISAAGQVLTVWGKQGVDRASMNLPTGIALDKTDNVYVVDSMNNRVLKFAPVK